MIQKNIKALVLISGGLDSMLATKILINQDVTVEGIYFFTGFSPGKHTADLLVQRKIIAQKRVQNVSDQFSINIHTVDITQRYKSVVFHPKHGFGAKKVNPCLDCKIFMLRCAYEWAMENGFDFIATGEVLGQRPMSQRRDTLNIVARDSSVKDRLLRPLSAKLMLPTLPEREGWIDREKLYGFSGRGRSKQIELAKEFGLKNLPTPAADCCFLIDGGFASRFLDFKQNAIKEDYTLDDIAILKAGRHIRPNERFKLIIGRDEIENNFLEKHAAQRISLYTPNISGPFAIIIGDYTEEDIMFAACLIARYSKGRNLKQVTVQINYPQKSPQLVNVNPLPVDSISKDWYI